MTKKVSKELKDKDYEKLGRLLVSIGEIGFKNKHQLYRASFLKGMVSGLGGVIGATIVVALLLFILSLIGEIPFVGELTDPIKNTIQSPQE
jgi:hypothetical protein